MNRRLVVRHLAALFLALASNLTVSGYNTAARYGEIELKNRFLSVQFDPSNGRLLKLLDLETKMDFVDPGGGDAALWQIDLLPGNTPAGLSPASARSFRWRRAGRREPALHLLWENFEAPAAERLRVEVMVTLDARAAMSRWRILIEDPGGLSMEKIRFPRIVSIREQPEERLAAPVWMGELTKDPRSVISNRPDRQNRLEWPYPGILSLQCLALYRDKGPGLYLSCDDTAAFRKAFAFQGGSGRKISYEMIHLPEKLRPPRTSYAPEYHALIGTFTGDWMTSAERYREWGTRQDWARKGRLNRGLVPDWLLETGLWVWNRGRSDQVLKPAEALKRELGIPVSVFWHWWHGCPYDTGFPEYLPPREGTGPFRQAFAEAHRGGIHAIVYMNQRLWGMTTRSWKEMGAQQYAVKTLDGTVRPEVYNTYTLQPCASMCIATPFWRNTYAGIAEEAVRDLGVDGIYMDQACSSLVCYDPTHGHPLGGGTFWMNGFRLLSNDIRNRTATAKKVLLAGEGCGEAWLPYLDLMLTLQVSRERYAPPGEGPEVIPFFQAVYHDCGVTYGSYSSLTIPPYDELWPKEFAPQEPLKLLDRRYASQFYLEQARAFVWGLQPTIANFRPSHLEERAEEAGYVLKLSKMRHAGLKYLLYGKFLRPPQLNVPAVPVEISRLSIYAGRRSRSDPPPGRQPEDDSSDDSGSGEPQTHFSITSPGILAGAWRAKDGDLGIALASIVDNAVPVVLNLKSYGVGLEDRIYLMDESGRRELTPSTSGSSVAFELAPRGACIVEVKKEAAI